MHAAISLLTAPTAGVMAAKCPMRKIKERRACERRLRTNGSLPSNIPAANAPAPRRSECFCFSACTAAEATHFLQSIPETISDTYESPWADYLHAVYGSTLRFPFQLSALNFFFTANARRGKGFRDRYPLPLRPCMSPYGGGHKRFPKCSPEYCAKWLSPSAAATEARAARVSTVKIFTRSSHPFGIGSAVLLERVSRHRLSELSHQLVEVIRMGSTDVQRAGGHGTIPLESCSCLPAYPPEVNAYGCWFYVVRGSGIFLDTQRTLLYDVHRRGLDELLARYEASRGAVPEWALEPPEAALRNRTGATWPLAFLAGALGYHTVQLWAHNRAQAELVATSNHACQHDETPAQRVQTVDPSATKSIRAAHAGGCVPLNLSTAWGQHRCQCQTRSHMLSCMYR